MVEIEPEQKRNTDAQAPATDEMVKAEHTIVSNDNTPESGSYNVVDGYGVAKVVTTDQVKRSVPNPTGKGGFGDNPQNRNPGGWRKQDTARYKLEQIIKMNDTQIQEYIDSEEVPTFDKRMAKAVQDGRWKELEGMINQVYGKPQESVDVTTQGEKITDGQYKALTTDELRNLAG